MSNRKIRKLAVLGSGGSYGQPHRLHFANIGVPVLLLDIAPKKLTPAEKAKGNFRLIIPAVKNRIVNSALQSLSNQAHLPIYKQSSPS
jgi:3-hydroxyacyl-CoA dehydrogenase